MKVLSKEQGGGVGAWGVGVGGQRGLKYKVIEPQESLFDCCVKNSLEGSLGER